MSTPASPTLRWLSIGLLLIGAVLSLLLPFVSATLFTIALGGVAIAAGVAQLIRLGSGDATGGKVLRGLSGALYLLGGLSLLVYPVQSTISLTLFMGFLLAYEGVTELAVAAARPIPARGLVLADGIVTAILGGLLIARWPGDSAWAIGTVLAAGMVMSALNLITAGSDTGTPGGSISAG